MWKKGVTVTFSPNLQWEDWESWSEVSKSCTSRWVRCKVSRETFHGYSLWWLNKRYTRCIQVFERKWQYLDMISIWYHHSLSEVWQKLWRSWAESLWIKNCEVYWWGLNASILAFKHFSRRWWSKISLESR